MKTLIAALALLASANAFAFSPTEVVKSLSDKTVQETLEGKVLTAIVDGPSARCAGCFGLVIKTLDHEAYVLRGMDFAGHFSVTIDKMEQ